MQIFEPKMEPGGRPEAEARCSQHKKVVFLVSRHNSIKNLDDIPKELILGRKTAFSAKKSVFLRYTYITPLFLGSDGPVSMGSYLPHMLR